MSVTVHEIIDEVAKRHRLKRADLLGQGRTKKLVEARHMAMYLARTLTNHSTTVIGRLFGGRDHTTIIHAQYKMKKMVSENETLMEETLAMCRALLNSKKDDIVIRPVNVLKTHYNEAEQPLGNG